MQSEESLDSSLPEIRIKGFDYDTRVKVLKMRARFDFFPTEEWGLEIHKGDIIQVLEQLKESETKGWWRGQVGENEGLFPLNYCEVIKIQEPKKIKIKKDAVEGGILVMQKRLFPNAFHRTSSKLPSVRSPTSSPNRSESQNKNSDESLTFTTTAGSIRIKNVDRLVRTLSTLSHESDLASTPRSENNKDPEVLKKEIENLREEVRKMEREAKFSQEQSKQKELEIKRLTEENEKLSKVNEKLSEEISSLTEAEEKKKTQQPEKKPLDLELEVTKRKVSKYKTKVKHRDITIQKLEKKVQQAETYQKQAQKASQLKKELEYSQQEVQRLKKELTFAHQESQGLKEGMAQLKHEIENVETTSVQDNNNEVSDSYEEEEEVEIVVPNPNAAPVATDAPLAPPKPIGSFIEVAKKSDPMLPIYPEKPEEDQTNSSASVSTLSQSEKEQEDQPNGRGFKMRQAAFFESKIMQKPALPPRPSQISLPRNSTKDSLVSQSARAKVSLFEEKIKQHVQSALPLRQQPRDFAQKVK